MEAPIKTQITDGCSYYDEKVFDILSPKPERVSQVALTICSLLKTEPPKEIDVLVGYKKVRLRWMKPDGHGGLIPR